MQAGQLPFSVETQGVYIDISLGFHVVACLILVSQ